MTYLVAVDIGGTFTDAVAVDEGGQVTIAKAFSTPPDFSVGVIDALGDVADQLRIALPKLLDLTPIFLHGTSVAENAIVNRTLAPSGLLTTRGFEHTLYMTRGGYGRWSGLTEDAKKDVLSGTKPPTLIPLQLIEPIAERTDSGGTVLLEPENREIAEALGRLVSQGVEAVGVCFLWSFRNGTNEQRVRELAMRHFPDLFLTLSSDLAPVEGEYERTSTVALNACLEPVVTRYLEQLQRRLHEHSFRGVVMLMQAHGGLLSLEDASSRAVGLIESGPVAGLVGSQAVGKLMGLDRVLAADMGGTTFKAGIVRGGRIERDREPNILRYHYSLQKVRVTSIGLAGGSIVSVEPITGVPKVGPRSAGSSPGPVCYGFGGTEPTVTDVDLLLGYLDSRYFHGGRIQLDVKAAADALRRQVAEPLDMSLMDAAGAVQRLANSMMYDLLHKETVEQGLDPSEYAMFSFGGTAGMHMTSIGQELGVDRVVVPHAASVYGAFGLVNADVIYSDATSRIMAMPVDPDVVNDVFASLEARVLSRITRAEQLASRDFHLQRTVDVRYRQQVHTITTAIPVDGALDGHALEDIGHRFDELYAERYGPEAGYREAGLELVSFGVSATVPMDRPQLRASQAIDSSSERARVETRRVYFAPAGEMLQADCYDFDTLVPGNRLKGPAIVWSPTTTIVVNPGQTARCDEYRNLVITWPKSRRANGAVVAEGGT